MQTFWGCFVLWRQVCSVSQLCLSLCIVPWKLCRHYLQHFCVVCVILAAIGGATGHAVGWSLEMDRNGLWQPQFSVLKFGVENKVCICVHASLLKVGVAMGVVYCKIAHNFQMDSQACTRFSGKFGHEPKDS